MFNYFVAYGINYRLLFKNLKDKKTNKFIPLTRSFRIFLEYDIPEDTILENNNFQIIQGFEDLINEKLIFLKS